MRSLRILSWLVIAAMALSIALAFASASFTEEASSIGGLAWGKVTLIDLYAGLALFGAWVALREPSIRRTAAWWIGLVVLGNLTAGLYVVVALREADDIEHLLLGARRR